MIAYSYLVFEEVSRQGSFIKAATALHMTPSAISHSISSLEEEWGFPVFMRERTGVRLTPEGVKMLRLVRELLEKEELITEEVAHFKGLTKGKITIGTFSSVCVRWIPELIREFKEEYPNIEVMVMQGDYQDVLEWVKSGQAEIGFETLPSEDRSLEEIPICTDPIYLVAPMDFRTLHSGYATAEDIQDRNLILQRSGYSTDTLSFIRKHKLKTRTRFYVDDDQAIISLVRQGLGICLMPGLIFEENELRDVRLIPLYPEEHRTIGLITRKKQQKSPVLMTMQDFIMDYAEEKGWKNIQ